MSSSAEDMYELVRDVESYPEFLPWCAGAEVLEEGPEHQVARVHVDLKLQKLSFTTRNRLEPGRALSLGLVEGPFRRLSGQWRFVPLDAAAARVSLELDFEFESRMLGALLGRAFQRIVDGQVQAFIARAAALKAAGRGRAIGQGMPPGT